MQSYCFGDNTVHGKQDKKSVGLRIDGTLPVSSQPGGTCMFLLKSNTFPEGAYMSHFLLEIIGLISAVIQYVSNISD